MKKILSITAMAALACSAIAMPMTEENLEILTNSGIHENVASNIINIWTIAATDSNLVYNTSIGYIIANFKPADITEMPDNISFAYTNVVNAYSSIETNTYLSCYQKYVFDKYFDPTNPSSILAAIDVIYAPNRAEFTDRILFGILISRNYIKNILDETADITHDYRIKNLLPIVTKNDVNPIEEAMKPIVNAFNAPLLAGLEDAYATIGVEFSEEQINILNQYRQLVTSVKDELLMRIDKLNPSEQLLLQTYYGVDEYNRIIKKLNGDDE